MTDKAKAWGGGLGNGKVDGGSPERLETEM